MASADAAALDEFIHAGRLYRDSLNAIAADLTRRRAGLPPQAGVTSSHSALLGLL